MSSAEKTNMRHWTKVIYIITFMSWSCASWFQVEQYDTYQSASLKDINPNKTINKDVGLTDLTESQYYKEMAYAYAQEKNCDKALELFQIYQNYKNADQPSPMVYSLDHDSLYTVAQCYYKNENYVSALNFAEKLLSDSQQKDVAQLSLLADIFVKAKSYSCAQELNQKIFSLTKDSFYLWQNFELALKTKDWTKASKILDLLTANNEDAYQITYAKYLIYKEQKDDQLALHFLLESEKLKPLDPKLLQSVAFLQRKLELWNDLYKSTSLYMTKFSFNYEMSENYLTSCAKLKKFEEIESYLDKLQTRNSDLDFSRSDFYADLQIYKAEKEWSDKKFNSAIKRLELVYSERPDYISNVLKYSKYLIWSNDLDKAIGVLKQSTYRHPDNDEIKILLGYINFKKDKEDEFLSLFKNVESFQNNESEIYSIMAEYWYKKSKPHDETISLINKALELKSENPNIKPILGQIMISNNELSRAMQIYENLYNDNPTNQEYAEILGVIYSKLDLVQKRADLENKSTRKPASNP